MNPLEALAVMRRKSWRLIWANVTERVYFDVTRGVDTISQVAKEDYPSQLENLDHGIHYASSWTSEIRFGFDVARNHLKDEFDQYTFIDIGCGKGKAQIVWEELLKRHRLRQRVLGVEYDAALIEIAKANHRKALKREGSFLHADATKVDYSAIGSKLIVYLYNPFDAAILAPVARALNHCKVVVIYNNPLHAPALLEAGFSILREKKGFHPQADTVIYSNEH